MKISSYISSFEKAGIRKLTLRMLLLLPLAFLIVVINYFIDPANLYWGKRKYNCIATSISNGYNVSGVENLDERLLQKQIIKHLNYSPKNIILGSSRSMNIGANIFQTPTLNNSVSGGTIEDYMAIINLYLQRSFIPQVIVLGLDPWILNVNNDQNRWQTIAKDYFEMATLIGTTSSHSNIGFTEQELNLFSLSYFQSATLHLKNQLQKRSSRSLCVATNEITIIDEQMILFDGRRQYDHKTLNISIEDLKNKAIEYASAPNVYSLRRYHQIDQQHLVVLENLITYLLHKNIKVVLYLPPYHPIAYQRMTTREETKIIKLVEDKFLSLAKKLSVPIVGSSDPAKYQLKEELFIDGMHSRDLAAEIIFRAELEQLKDFGIKTLAF